MATEPTGRAVFVALGWSAGSFEFVPGPIEGDDEVCASTTHLLLEGARRQDEREHVTEALES